MTDPPRHGMSRLRSREAAAVVVAALGAGGLWFVLSVATGLIFHFMPAAPILAAVWVRRAARPDGPVPWPALLVHVAGSLVIVAIAGTGIAAAGASLDGEGPIATVVAVGIGLAIWLGRRGGRQTAKIDDRSPAS